MAAAVPGRGLGGDAAEVALTAAAVLVRVAVQDLLPRTAPRHADAVVMTRDRGEVQGNQHGGIAIPSAAQIAERALVGIVAIDPLETCDVMIELV